MKIQPLNLLQHVILSRALFTAAELDIAEHLNSGKKTLAQLTGLTSTTAETLERLLNLLCLHEIIVLNDTFYELPTSSQILLEGHPESIKPFLLHDDETRWNSFGNLTYSIQTGNPSFDMLYGQDYFTSLKQNPELSKRFDIAMNVISLQESHTIAEKITFSGAIADIGGGNGQLLKIICNQQKSITDAFVFDLPTVVSAIPDSANLQRIGGSFFEGINITANTFLLKRILHDWNDEDAKRILVNIAAAMRPTDSLWIFEGILDQSSDKKALAAIDLALLTIFGGKERNSKEFTALCSASGLKINKTIPLTPTLSGMCCSKIT